MLFFRRLLLVATIPAVVGGCVSGPSWYSSPNPDILAPVPAGNGPIQSGDLPPPGGAQPGYTAAQPGYPAYPQTGAAPGYPQTGATPGYPQPATPAGGYPANGSAATQPGSLQAQASGQDAASQPMTAQPQVAATMPPPPAGLTVDPKLIEGTWSIGASGEACSLALTQTAGNGGNRAAPLRCTSDELKSISAWAFEGGQMVLKNKAGAVVVRLNPAGQKRFNGMTMSTRREVIVYQ